MSPRRPKGEKHPSQPSVGKDELSQEEVKELSEAEQSRLTVTELPGWASFTRGQKQVLEFLPTAKSQVDAARQAGLREAFVTEEGAAHPLFRFAVLIRKLSRGKNSKPFADEDIRVSKAFEFLKDVIAGTIEADAQQLKAADLMLKHSLSKVHAGAVVVDKGVDDLELNYGSGNKP